MAAQDPIRADIIYGEQKRKYKSRLGFAQRIGLWNEKLLKSGNRISDLNCRRGL